jgi:predicted transposase YbfD/YdcC
MHTQTLTAQKIHHERGADYVMTVKANQKTLYET